MRHGRFVLKALLSPSQNALSLSGGGRGHDDKEGRAVQGRPTTPKSNTWGNAEGHVENENKGHVKTTIPF